MKAGLFVIVKLSFSQHWGGSIESESSVVLSVSAIVMSDQKKEDQLNKPLVIDHCRLVPYTSYSIISVERGLVMK